MIKIPGFFQSLSNSRFFQVFKFFGNPACNIAIYCVKFYSRHSEFLPRFGKFFFLIKQDYKAKIKLRNCLIQYKKHWNTDQLLKFQVLLRFICLNCYLQDFPILFQDSKFFNNPVPTFTHIKFYKSGTTICTNSQTSVL